MKYTLSHLKQLAGNYFGKDIPLENRICYTMCLCGLLFSVAGCLETILAEFSLFSKILSIFSLFAMAVFAYLAFHKKQIHAVSAVLTVFFGNVLFPVMFITQGGHRSGMPFYFFIILPCIVFVIRKGVRTAVFTLTLAEYILLEYISFRYPQFISPIAAETQFIDAACGIAISGGFIFLFNILTAEQYENDRCQILHLTEQYERQANVDDLTDLYNRRYFRNILQLLIPTIGKTGSLYLAMFDIDNFKKVNDANGHVYGDTVLKSFSDILKEESINGITSFRYGGEEFLLLVPGSTCDGALEITERVLQKTRERISRGKEGGFVTVSAGLQQYADGMTYAEFLENVDAKLYKAKATGKNRVVRE